jgi:YHS domain-containing protein
MTAATRNAAGPALNAFALERRGRRHFKNVTEGVDLYALTLAAQGDDARLPVDPVCRMAVDPSRSSELRRHRGVEYRFCSAVCAGVFDNAPDRYTGSA